MTKIITYTMKTEIETTICKVGKNLFARIPAKEKYKTGRGDIVKLTIVKKALHPKDVKRLRLEAENMVNNPNGEKLRGQILGYDIEIPLAKIINSLPKKKAKDLLVDAIINNCRK